MIDVKLLREAGIDYEVGIERFLDDATLYEAVLREFLKDDVLEKARKAFMEKDINTLYETIHEAKGSTGNVGLIAVYTEASVLSALLKGKKCIDAELTESFKKFESIYQKTKEGIVAALK